MEFFNALNHPEFAQPTLVDNATNIKSVDFGQITTTGTSAAQLRALGSWGRD